ncbi:type IV pilus assembly protein FimV, partial [Ramlibacter sp. MAHUQ-53]|uniref:type IV pilus assembly protein FimV n=1 Tax=unclassified Ramlibacter TaxID=2617605 RepID=UPI0036442FA7
PAPAPAAEARPRLKLEAVEVRPRLAASAAARPAVGEPVASAAARADAQAQALSAAAEELQRNAERILSMEADLKVLREGMLKRDAALTDLRDRLEKADRERYANGLVYTLGALLAGALGLALVLWRRGRSAAQAQWWGESHQPETPSRPVEERLIEEPPAGAAAPAGASVAVAAAASPDPVPAPAPGSTADAVPAPGTRAAALASPGPLSAPMGLSARRPGGEADGLRVSDPLPLTSDELSDIQQEADFFVSLGEYDRAIEVLRNHIEAHPQASPVAWLDLLEIHHKLGRQEEYEQLRRDFEWLFNAKAPAFANFSEDQHGLEVFSRLMARIQEAWPGRRVLQVIDDAIFRRPGADGEESLTLQAYRDLLFLHNVASEMAAGDGAPVLPSASNSVVAVDVDLDELAGQGPETQPAPMMVVPSMPEVTRGNENSLDFDFESAEFKLPPAQRPPAS